VKFLVPTVYVHHVEFALPFFYSNLFFLAGRAGAQEEDGGTFAIDTGGI